jgi:hypothetical protein
VSFTDSKAGQVTVLPCLLLRPEFGRLRLRRRRLRSGAGTCGPGSSTAGDWYLPGRCLGIIGNGYANFKDPVVIGSPDVFLVHGPGNRYGPRKSPVTEFRTVSALTLLRARVLKNTLDFLLCEMEQSRSAENLPDRR